MSTAIVLKKSTARELVQQLAQPTGAAKNRHIETPRDLSPAANKYNFQVIRDTAYVATSTERRLKVRGGLWDFGHPGYAKSLEIESTAVVGDFAGTGELVSDLATTTVTIAAAATKYVALLLASSTVGGIQNATILAAKHFDAYPVVAEISGYTILEIIPLAKIVNTAGTLLITPYHTSGNINMVVSNEHAFFPSKSETKGSVDIAEGSWYMNGTKVTDTAGTADIGSTAAPYIVATITHGTGKPLVPATITVAAQAALAADDDFTTKRNICKVNHTAGNVSSITRFQVGDIYQNLDAIETAAGVWEAGDSAGADYVDVMTDFQYNGTSHKLQMKKSRISVIDGSTYVGKEDSSWTDITTASECP